MNGRMRDNRHVHLVQGPYIQYLVGLAVDEKTRNNLNEH